MAASAAVFYKHFADPSVILGKINKHKKPAGVSPTSTENYSVNHPTAYSCVNSDDELRFMYENGQGHLTLFCIVFVWPGVPNSYSSKNSGLCIKTD